MTTTLSRPPLVVRVAVSGHRDLGDDLATCQRLRERVESVFSVLKESVKEIHRQDVNNQGASLYDPDTLPHFRLASGLAAGADQLVAQIAVLDNRWSLEAVLPFTADQFRQDFGTSEEPTHYGAALGLPWSDDLAAFEALLTAAGPACIQLCGATAPKELRNRAYFAVGQTLVRRCEVLLAVWDGSEAAGKGGTAEVVEFALRNRVPVIWVDAGGVRETQWLSDIEDFYRLLNAAEIKKFSLELLDEYLKRLLLGELTVEQHDGVYNHPYTLAQFRDDIDLHCNKELCRPKEPLIKPGQTTEPLA